MSEEQLTFTGERFLPDCEREIWYEHFHRYAMITSIVSGKVVLDAACGEGYGSDLLARYAAQVTGIDISAEAIKHANTTYHRANLSYQQSDVLSSELPTNSFDVVVSFETLEHLAEHEQLLKNFKRVLKPGGLLVISSPDKSEYSDKTGFNNEYHVKELYRHELEELLQAHFKYSKWFGQKLMFNSTIWALEQPLKSCQFDCIDEQGQVLNQPPFTPMYYVVMASDEPINNDLCVDYYTFTEQAETVYGHYNAVIRAHIEYENKYHELKKTHENWLKHPVIGRFIKWFNKD